MSIRIAPIILFISLWIDLGWAEEEKEFVERFALASEAGRERLLKELVAGTDEHSYFHCLHYQNTRNIAALHKALEAWAERQPEASPQRTEIELREAIFNYPGDQAGSLEKIANHLGLKFDAAPEFSGEVADPDRPSQLDPATITTSAFLTEASRSGDFDNFIGREAAGWLLATGQPLPDGLNERFLIFGQRLVTAP